MVCALVLRRALALLLVGGFANGWAGLVVHMPLEARPSEGLKETGGAFCFITCLIGLDDWEVRVIGARAKGLVQRGPR